ncbi:hypothetical protein PC110_g2932 [Phytophthora cactorum]|uniref:Uncharacterized protein n=1 Tax=Phytophthora cactorum TaxID=29920 RepID=A0A329SY96_9STRA|nr:hypothetical protein PC112_g2137 [Phytophthora cactorum]KAG2943413.1 hypothetical protein PC115_g812 [Phytophthora cactorum]RAW40888.1 hypothetical protein PC110_g2932 [Phytophthora cactorum]
MDFIFGISQKLETLDEYIKLFNAQNPQHKTDMFKDKFAILVSKATAYNAATATLGGYIPA